MHLLQHAATACNYWEYSKVNISGDRLMYRQRAMCDSYAFHNFELILSRDLFLYLTHL